MDHPTTTAHSCIPEMRCGPEDIRLIEAADTFFLGTTHAISGNDASHRGGPPGFVRVAPEHLWWPDYPGNNMFNSFGNLSADPTAALLFMDFRAGITLQLSGARPCAGATGPPPATAPRPYAASNSFRSR